MPLNIQDVETLLNKQIQAYLRERVTYEGLRKKCLTVAPVRPVIDALSALLGGMAVEDIALKTQELTQEAHYRQMISDAAEEESDKATKSKCEGETKELTTKITSLEFQLLAVNAIYLIQKVAHSGARAELEQARSTVRDLENRQYPTQNQKHDRHQHGHPSPQEPHSHSRPLDTDLHRARQRVYELEAKERTEYVTYIKHQTDKSTIEREISNCRSDIKVLSRRKDELDRKEVARNRRRLVRASCLNELDSNALSHSNAEQLNKMVKETSASIIETCSQMKRLMKERCYDVFLKQLQSQIDTLELNKNEKIALNEIVMKMQEHQADVCFKQQQEAELADLRSSLQVLEQRLTDKKAQLLDLTQRNKDLVNANELLGGNLLTFKTSHEKLLEQRNRYATFSLAAVGVTAISSITAYFLIQAGVLALVPGVNLILTAVAGVAIAGLGVTCAVAAIGAYCKQSEIDACEQTISNNAGEMERNTLTMNQSQKTDIPGLTEAIENLKRNIAEKVVATEHAGKKAASSIKQAEAIQVGGLSRANSFGLFSTSAVATAVAWEHGAPLKELPIAEEVCLVQPSAPPGGL